MGETIAIVATALGAALGTLIIRLMKASGEQRRADRAQLADLIRGNTASNQRLTAMIDKIDGDHGGHDVT